MREPIGFIVLSQLKTTEDTDAWYPLSYGGCEHRHSRNLLLRDRGATLFSSRKEAYDALTNTCMEETSKGHDWPNLFTFEFLPVYEAPFFLESNQT